MSFKVQVGPPQIAIHQGQTVLVTEPDGQIGWPSDRGLYFFDTRVISAWALYANGETLGTAERRRHRARRRPHLPHQPQLPHRGRHDRRAHLGPGARPRRRRRPARGHRHHQPRRQAGALQPGDRDPLRLRRHLRGEVRQDRPPRPHRHRLVGSRSSGCARSIATTISSAPSRSPRMPSDRARRLCQRPAELRDPPRSRRHLARLPAV